MAELNSLANCVLREKSSEVLEKSVQMKTAESIAIKIQLIVETNLAKQCLGY